MGEGSKETSPSFYVFYLLRCTQKQAKVWDPYILGSCGVHHRNISKVWYPRDTPSEWKIPDVRREIGAAVGALGNPKPLNSLASSNLRGDGSAPSTHRRVAPVRTCSELRQQSGGK
jgi:hypothetical protein